MEGGASLGSTISMNISIDGSVYPIIPAHYKHPLPWSMSKDVDAVDLQINKLGSELLKLIRLFRVLSNRRTVQYRTTTPSKSDTERKGGYLVSMVNGFPCHAVCLDQNGFLIIGKGRCPVFPRHKDITTNKSQCS